MNMTMQNVIEHIHSNLDKPLKLEDLSELAGLSSSQFHKKFKTLFNKTPFQYIESLKMEKAKEGILKSSSSVQDLAFKFGYHDYETFSRAFKRHHFIAPGDIKLIINYLENRDFKDEDDNCQFEVMTLSENYDDELLKDFIVSYMSNAGFDDDTIGASRFFKVDSSPISKAGDLINKKLQIYELHNLTSEDK